jgi:hypothetical protein
VFTSCVVATIWREYGEYKVNAIDERHWSDVNLCRKLKVCICDFFIWRNVRCILQSNTLSNMFLCFSPRYWQHTTIFFSSKNTLKLLTVNVGFFQSVLFLEELLIQSVMFQMKQREGFHY